ncbi:Spy/CpxP family protein refolding chaperone [Methylovorus glucosotrophus]|uniref:Spy/CpxP family protein refolding chaperone n=1 Tax=Methylovorus glucosotrophus TaxID=266009 RepID=UPI00133135F9|nr:Spy/CpxP family protein refolding chaperone [Methylovorus glucosotrophus]KAF0844097.1 Spy/CpxP family protein refolding chaperone [Methylovorus glucosotrophus]
MNTSTLYKLTLAIGLFGLSLPLLLQAQPLLQDPPAPGFPHHMGPALADNKQGPGLPPYLRGLDLSEAQEDQIFALMHDQIPALREQQKQRRHALDELDALAKAPSFDERKAQQLAEKLSEIEKQFVLSRVRNDFKINGILTAEQRKQLEETKAQFGKHKPQEPVKFTPQNSKKPALTLI